MSQRSLTDDECREALDALISHATRLEAADFLGISGGAFDNRIRVGKTRGIIPPTMKPDPKAKRPTFKPLEPPQGVYECILNISDLHAPYHHPDALAFIKSLKEKYEPDLYISGGDELDFHAISFHDSDPDLASASDELIAGRVFLQELERLIPVMYVLESNHTSLAYRRAKAHGIPKHLITSYRGVVFGERDEEDDIYYPDDRGRGWKWFPFLVIKTPHMPIYYCHGKKAKAETNMFDDKMCFAQFHHHSKFETVYISTPNALLWGMTSGCMIDTNALAFAYNKLDAKRPLIGCSIVRNGFPELKPMPLDMDGRWTGVTP